MSLHILKVCKNFFFSKKKTTKKNVHSICIRVFLDCLLCFFTGTLVPFRSLRRHFAQSFHFSFIFQWLCIYSRVHECESTKPNKKKKRTIYTYICSFFSHEFYLVFELFDWRLVFTGRNINFWLQWYWCGPLDC